MKNITVSVDENVYHRARVYAAEHKTSVSAVVRELLESLTAKDTEAERLQKLEAQTLERIRQRGNGFRASNRLCREETHDRNALR